MIYLYYLYALLLALRYHKFFNLHFFLVRHMHDILEYAPCTIMAYIYGNRTICASELNLSIECNIGRLDEHLKCQSISFSVARLECGASYVYVHMLHARLFLLILAWHAFILFRDYDNLCTMYTRKYISVVCAMNRWNILHTMLFRSFFLSFFVFMYEGTATI